MMPKPPVLWKGDRSMTYIAAFKCLGGVVICADTQETIGDYKQYTEKLLVVPNAAYPLAVGGAGAGDVVEPIIDKIIHKAADEKPSTQKDLLSMRRSAVNFVFENEISALVLSRHRGYRSSWSLRNRVRRIIASFALLGRGSIETTAKRQSLVLEAPITTLC
jgi:hypothetical protein